MPPLRSSFLFFQFTLFPLLRPPLLFLQLASFPLQLSLSSPFARCHHFPLQMGCPLVVHTLERDRFRRNRTQRNPTEPNGTQPNATERGTIGSEIRRNGNSMKPNSNEMMGTGGRAPYRRGRLHGPSGGGRGGGFADREVLDQRPGGGVRDGRDVPHQRTEPCLRGGVLEAGLALRGRWGPEVLHPARGDAGLPTYYSTVRVLIPASSFFVPCLSLTRELSGFCVASGLYWVPGGGEGC